MRRRVIDVQERAANAIQFHNGACYPLVTRTCHSKAHAEIKTRHAKIHRPSPAFRQTRFQCWRCCSSSRSLFSSASASFTWVQMEQWQINFGNVLSRITCKPCSVSLCSDGPPFPPYVCQGQFAREKSMFLQLIKISQQFPITFCPPVLHDVPLLRYQAFAQTHACSVLLSCCRQWSAIARTLFWLSRPTHAPLPALSQTSEWHRW